MELNERAMARPDVEIDSEDASLVAERPFDPIAFDVAMDKWQGFLREQMLADGFATTQELMDDIRGR